MFMEDKCKKKKKVIENVYIGMSTRNMFLTVCLFKLSICFIVYKQYHKLASLLCGKRGVR